MSETNSSRTCTVPKPTSRVEDNYAQRAARLGIAFGGGLLAVVALAVTGYLALGSGGAVACVALGAAVAVPAVAAMWQWSQPAAVAFSVGAGLVAVLTLAELAADTTETDRPAWHVVTGLELDQ